LGQTHEVNHLHVIDRQMDIANMPLGIDYLQRNIPSHNGKDFLGTENMSTFHTASLPVGSLGAMRNSIIFKQSKMGQMLENNTLNIPEGRRIPCDENGRVMLFFVVAD
jgi:hypothetical protein